MKIKGAIVIFCNENKVSRLAASRPQLVAPRSHVFVDWPRWWDRIAMSSKLGPEGGSASLRLELGLTGGTTAPCRRGGTRAK